MPEVTEWWLYAADYDGSDGREPSRKAFSLPHAQRFTSLGDAVSATSSIPQGKYPWVWGDDILHTPNDLKPMRKLLYQR